MIKNVWIYIKGILSRKKTTVVETCGNVVDKEALTEEEIEEAKKTLSKLQSKLEKGIVDVDRASTEAEEIIQRHKDIVTKARSKRGEYSGKAQRIKDILNTMDKM